MEVDEEVEEQDENDKSDLEDVILSGKPTVALVQVRLPVPRVTHAY